MSAPARTRTTQTTKATQTKAAQAKAAQGTTAERADRGVVTHNRSAAAERAYARRAGRTPGSRPKGAQAGPERKSGSASRVSFVVLVMGLLVVGVVTTLWLSTQSTADSLKLAQAQQATQNLAAKVQLLQQQIDQGGSPAQIAKLAQQLGMVPANNLAHIVVGPNGQVTVVGTPSPATSPAPPPPPSSSSTSTDTPTSTTSAPPSGSTQSTAGG
ncbi:MAG TPA: septum formation initiator [Pseudonocardiaceae bacterium]|jgi:Tfp pilus assembly protein PilV|nr:septum formation initiator [Pseudonocardiaceae bacterium]